MRIASRTALAGALLCLWAAACSDSTTPGGVQILAPEGSGTAGAGVTAGVGAAGTAAGATAGTAVGATAGMAPPQTTAGMTSGGGGGQPVAGQMGQGDPAGSGGASGGGGSAGEDPQMTDGGMPQGVDAGGESAGPIPIDPPEAEQGGCIADVSPGDHTFTCQGITFQVMVDEQCTQYACGLIFEVHGASMTGDIMRTNTRLHELGAAAGYLVVHPTTPTGTWDWGADPPVLVDFMDRMIDVFHVDRRRIHMTGFSMGSAMTFWFLCNHRDDLASVAPVTGSSADQVVDEESGDNCIQSIDGSWQPRVPILFMSGTTDNALTASAAQARTDGLVERLGLMGGDEIDGDGTWRRRRWTGDDGMIFDFLTHDYSSAILQGHCIPGGPATDLIFACAGGSLNWGETVLQWFIDTPKAP